MEQTRPRVDKQPGRDIGDNSLICKPFARSSLLVTDTHTAHKPLCGINPLLDAAAVLLNYTNEINSDDFNLKVTDFEKELKRAVDIFHSTLLQIGYDSEYSLAGKYIICRTLDDVICHSLWGQQNNWQAQYLVESFFQDNTADNSQERFFVILARVLQEPEHYIDLIELIYTALSLGFEGKYRNHPSKQQELLEIRNDIYRIIRDYRGNVGVGARKQIIKRPAPVNVRLSFADIKKAPIVAGILLAVVTIAAITFINIYVHYGANLVTTKSADNYEQQKI